MAQIAWTASNTCLDTSSANLRLHERMMQLPTAFVDLALLSIFLTKCKSRRQRRGNWRTYPNGSSSTATCEPHDRQTCKPASDRLYRPNLPAATLMMGDENRENHGIYLTIRTVSRTHRVINACEQAARKFSLTHRRRRRRPHWQHRTWQEEFEAI